MNRILSITVCSAIVLFGLTTLAISQNTNSRRPSANSQSGSASTSDTAAEREKIWNSPTMLHARAWVQEYCERSAKISPEEAQQYMKELENLTPTQMKLWLLKFEHEQEMIKKQQADFEMTRQASLRQAMSVDQATQQAYSNINRGINEAASTAEESIRTQAAQAAERAQDKANQTAVDAANVDSFYGGYGGIYGGYGGLYGGYGFVPHIHIHVHPQIDADQ